MKNVTSGQTALHCLIFSILGFTVVLMACNFQKGFPQTPPDTICEREMRWIGNAFLRYKAEHHNTFPQSVYIDSSGFEHSWRVVLLPYLCEEWCLDGYHFDQPWNSEANQAWASRKRLSDLGVLYHCPYENQALDDPHTSYLMLVRPKFSVEGQNAEGMPTLPDSAIIVVESADSGIKWFEPKDIDIEHLWQKDSPFGIGRLNSRHPKVVKALRADGTVIDIPKSISQDRLKRLLEGSLTTTDVIILKLHSLPPVFFVVCFAIVGVLTTFYFWRRRRKGGVLAQQGITTGTGKGDITDIGKLGD